MAKQKIALITGANKGIGFQIAKDLGQLGFDILLTARNQERGIAALEELQKLGVKGTFIQMDVGDPKSIQQAFGTINEEVDCIDVLINNAGILLDEAYSILNAPVHMIQRTFQINAFGALWVCQRFLPLLGRGSRVIMVSSGAGQFCQKVSAWAPIYSISKTTMNAITKQLHLALQPKGIIINAMSPGWVRTDMGGQGASRSVEQGAQTAVWLATESPASIDGQFLRDKQVIDW